MRRIEIRYFFINLMYQSIQELHFTNERLARGVALLHVIRPAPIDLNVATLLRRLRCCTWREGREAIHRSIVLLYVVVVIVVVVGRVPLGVGRR